MKTGSLAFSTMSALVHQLEWSETRRLEAELYRLNVRKFTEHVVSALKEFMPESMREWIDDIRLIESTGEGRVSFSYISGYRTDFKLRKSTNTMDLSLLLPPPQVTAFFAEHKHLITEIANLYYRLCVSRAQNDELPLLEDCEHPNVIPDPFENE